ncbi:MAG: hypothetical protein ACP5HM_04300 [Anaerolineae bacterium]
MFNLRRRLYFLIPMLLAALLQHTLHESTHYFVAQLMGEEVTEFRFLTNGWLTSRVFYATPVAERSGAHWLVIAWAPAVVTTLIGYLVYATRRPWLTSFRPLNAGLWFFGVYCMLIDPFYFAILSLAVGGDVNAVQAVGWSPWPVRLVALVIFSVNVVLTLRWRREASEEADRYLPAEIRGATS